MIEILVKDMEAKMTVKGSAPEVVGEMNIILKTFYNKMREFDKIAALLFEIDLMELVGGKEMNEEMLEEYFEIQDILTPEEAEIAKEKIRRHYESR